MKWKSRFLDKTYFRLGLKFWLVEFYPSYISMEDALLLSQFVEEMGGLGLKVEIELQ